jgi:long-chain acyl-CoA synthetase
MAEANSLHDNLLEVALRFPDKIAIQSQRQKGFDSYTYSELVKKSKLFGYCLIRQGIHKGDRIGIILDNCPEWVFSYFGTIFAGAIAVPLDPQLSSRDVCNLLLDAGAKAIFGATEHIELLRDVRSKLGFIDKFILVDSQEGVDGFLALNSDSAIGIDRCIWPKVNRDDIASLLYTSGTVAEPKGVMLTHGNFLSDFTSCRSLNLSSHKDCFLSILPLFHAYSFMATLILPLFTGAKVVYPQNLKSYKLQECMKEAGVSVVIGVPQVFSSIYKEIVENINKLSFSKRVLISGLINLLWNIRRLAGLNLSKIFLRKIHNKFGKDLRYLVSGGARLDTDICRGLLKFGFTILEGYGLTETAAVVTLNLSKKSKINSVGKPLPGIALKIVNPDATGGGEIAISGGNVMRGYFNKPQQTQEALKNGWFHTGDLGYIDRQGYLYISGRAKEIIVLSSGKNIYPEEIESYYEKAVSVKELCVFEMRDSRGLDSLQAVVVPNFDYFKKAEGGNILGKIKWEFENISYSLPSYKHITRFILAKDDLPRTRLGKIKRYEVKNKYLEQLALQDKSRRKVTKVYPAEDLKIINSEIGSKVIGYVKDALSLEERPDIDDHLELDLGVDSLGKVELITGLERLFGISISDDEAGGISSIRQIISKLEELVFKKEKRGSVVRTKEPSWYAILHQEPPREIIDKINLQSSIFNRIFSLAVIKLFFVLFKIFWRIRVEGRENLPKEGPFVLCPNHSSYLDGFIVAVGVPFSVEMNLYFIGWKQIFEHPTLKWSNKAARLIGIDSSAELMGTMQVASFILRNKKNICMFPEGQRTIDGKISEFRKGVGILVKELNVPVVPVAIKGAFQAWPRTRRMPRPCPIRIVFGKPVTYGELKPSFPKDTNKSEYELIALFLQEEVVKLLGKDA